jgi:hypothetical protein
MAAPPLLRRDISGRLLVVLLTAVMGGFVLTSLVAQHTSARVESLADKVVSVSAPSIDRLATMRSKAVEVELALSEYIRRRPVSKDLSGSARIEGSLKALNDDVQEYLRLPVLQGERPYWSEIQAALHRFDNSIQKARLLVESGADRAAQEEFWKGVQPARHVLIEKAQSAIEFHAQTSRIFASE